MDGEQNKPSGSSTAEYYFDQTGNLSRVHRERLAANGFIREVVKGWYVSVLPYEHPGDSTSWYVSFWGFCAQYLTDRYGEDYCISAEQSLLLQTGDQTVPRQLIVRSTKGNNLPTSLLFNTSLFVMKPTLPQKAEMPLLPVFIGRPITP